jgi:hypothetical protein
MSPVDCELGIGLSEPEARTALIEADRSSSEKVGSRWNQLAK